MGIGLRIFFVNEDGSLRRMPLTRYQRLLGGDPKECFPEYAGKRLRYAEVAVEYFQRKPMRILRFMPFILTFDSEGRIDSTELEKERRLSFDATPTLVTPSPHTNVVDAVHLFLQKRVVDKYRWKPTRQIVEAIVKAIFARKEQ